MRIAVTGVIGSGKSSVAAQLAAQLEAYHCDTDKVCRDLLERGAPGYQGVKDKWGDRFLGADGGINRSRLRGAVFSDPGVRKTLETILHPLVQKEVTSIMKQCDLQGRSIVVEVPLLFEVGWQDDFDCVVTVDAEKKHCLERIIKRDGVSEEQAEQAIAAQMPGSEKRRLADYVIDNNSVFEETERMTADLAETLKRKNDGC